MSFLRYSHDSGGDFANEMFAGMQDYLSQDQPAAEAVPTEGQALAALTAELAKCANQLEEMGHPAARKADAILYKFFRG